LLPNIGPTVSSRFKPAAAPGRGAAGPRRRGEPYAGGREYARYRSGGGEFFAPGISTRYRSPTQLVALGLICPARWF
jgi:hypothetical protein